MFPASAGMIEKKKGPPFANGEPFFSCCWFYLLSRIRLDRGFVNSLRSLAELDHEDGEAGDGHTDTDVGGDVQRQAETDLGVAQVSGDHGGHESGRNGADPVQFALLDQVGGCGPEDDGGQGLVGPAEVTPDDPEVGAGDQEADNEQRNRQEEAFAGQLLGKINGVGDDQPGAAERGVARGDRQDDGRRRPRAGRRRCRAGWWRSR